MKLSLRKVAEWLGIAVDSAAMVTGWSIDSRSLQAGDLFFAIRGPNHDGHAFVRDVLQKGAAAVVVDREVSGSSEAEGRILRVEDTVQALQQLAAQARRHWGGRLVAVTGSAGKTSTKEIIAALLEEGCRTAKNEGNLNNHIGLP